MIDDGLIVDWTGRESDWFPADWSQVKLGRIAVKSDDDALRVLAKRAHDVTAGLRTLRFAVESIGDGYRFDDAIAPAKITAMEKAVAALEKETVILSAILEASFKKY